MNLLNSYTDAYLVFQPSMGSSYKKDLDGETILSDVEFRPFGNDLQSVIISLFARILTVDQANFSLNIKGFDKPPEVALSEQNPAAWVSWRGMCFIITSQRLNTVDDGREQTAIQYSIIPFYI